MGWPHAPHCAAPVENVTDGAGGDGVPEQAKSVEGSVATRKVTSGDRDVTDPFSLGDAHYYAVVQYGNCSARDIGKRAASEEDSKHGLGKLEVSYLVRKGAGSARAAPQLLFTTRPSIAAAPAAATWLSHPRLFPPISCKCAHESWQFAVASAGVRPAGTLANTTQEPEPDGTANTVGCCSPPFRVGIEPCFFSARLIASSYR